MLENMDKPQIFTAEFQELLQSIIDKKAAKNYQKLIPQYREILWRSKTSFMGHCYRNWEIYSEGA